MKRLIKRDGEEKNKMFSRAFLTRENFFHCCTTGPRDFLRCFHVVWFVSVRADAKREREKEWKKKTGMLVARTGVTARKQANKAPGVIGRLENEITAPRTKQNSEREFLLLFPSTEWSYG
jgi:hypothetical protein